MLNSLPAVASEQKAMTVSELSLEVGLSEKKISMWLRRYDVSVDVLQDAIILVADFDSKMYKACALLKDNDNNANVVQEIYEIRSALVETSLIKLSSLLKRFQGANSQEVIEVIQDAHKSSGRRFMGTTLDELLLLAEQDENIVWLDHLVEEYQKLKGQHGVDVYYEEDLDE